MSDTGSGMSFLVFPWTTRGDSGEGLQEASSFLGEQGRSPSSLSLVPFFVHSRALSRWKCVCVCVCVCVCFWPSHDAKNGMRGRGEWMPKNSIGNPSSRAQGASSSFLAVSSESQALSWSSVSVVGEMNRRESLKVGQNDL